MINKYINAPPNEYRKSVTQKSIICNLEMVKTCLSRKCVRIGLFHFMLSYFVMKSPVPCVYGSQAIKEQMQFNCK